jgi:hypothetical protein
MAGKTGFGGERSGDREIARTAHHANVRRTNNRVRLGLKSPSATLRGQAAG